MTEQDTMRGKFFKGRGAGAAAWLALASFFTAGCVSNPPATQARTVQMAAASCNQPPYPAEARSSGAEGVTVLSFDVNAEGKVTRVAILQPSGTTAGHRALDELALATLKACSFPPAPGFLQGSSQVSYSWRLQD